MMGMFSKESDAQYIGKILKELNSGKSLQALLLEMSWTERARLLMNIKSVRRCYNDFQQEMSG